jgi:hypothetical protein
MKKFLSIILLVLLLPQFALANNVSNLKVALDEFHYSMQVEWDQKDKVFEQEAKMKLIREFDTLLKNGLTKQEMIKATGVDIEKYSVEIQGLRLHESDEIINFLITRKEFKQGASWVGDAVLATVFFTPILIMIGFMIHSSIHKEERLNKINSCLELNPNQNDHCFDLI